MDILGVLLCAGLAAALVLLVTLQRKIDALPYGVWNTFQRDRAADERRALDTLQEAAFVKVNAIVVALRQHEESLEARLRNEVAQAELRARVIERHSSDAGIALSAASALVATLRELIDELPDLLVRAALIKAGHLPRDPSVPGDLANRPTVEPPPQVDVDTRRKPGAAEPVSRERSSPRPTGVQPALAEDDRLSADEMTVVAKRPLVGAQAPASDVAPRGQRGTP